MDVEENFHGQRPNLLQSDCSRCFGLCCTALVFERSSDFAFAKDEGEPCVNLRRDFSCGIHERLRVSGMKGCTVFECFGAGQRVSQDTFGGMNWRENPAVRQQMFAVFPMMKELHEFLWYLGCAADMLTREGPSPDLNQELSLVREAVEAVAQDSAECVLSADLDRLQGQVGRVLAKASEWLRARQGERLRLPSPTSALARRLAPGADLMGVNLAGSDLRCTNLRGSYLIAVNLEGANLDWADLIGADLRDANLANATLENALFVNQQQVNSARGDARTRLPGNLTRPPHW